METPTWLSPEEYAALMRVSRMTVLKLLKRGEITGAVRVGKQWRIPNPEHRTEEK